MAGSISLVLCTAPAEEADGLARRLVDWPRIRAWLDVGCGSGVYSIHFCRRNPKLRATLLDRPAVLDVAEEIVATSGVAQRVAFRGLDLYDVGAEVG